MDINDKNILRSTELTAVLGRTEFNKLAKIRGEKDWENYRELYDDASNLKTVTNFPLQLDIELNASCNLKCPMCPISAESPKGKGKSTWFSFDLYKEIIDTGVREGLKAIKLNYINEPLIRSDLFKFIEYANNAGVLDIYLSTNGLLMDNDISLKMIKSGLTRIQISLDATSSEVYDILRPGGDFSKTIRNINSLISLKEELKSITPLIRVNFVKTETNLHQVEDFISYWKNKVDMIGIQEFINPPISSEKISGAPSRNIKKEGFKCSFPFKQLVINNEKDILPCCTFWGEYLKIGKLKSADSIKEAWNSKEMKNLRELHSHGKYYENPICKKCVESS